MEDLDEAQDVMDVMEGAQAVALEDRGRRLFPERMDPTGYYTEEEFYARYRLSKECVNTLLEHLRHRLPDTPNNRGLRIPPKLQLLVTLRYLATGDLQLTVGDTSDMSQTSVCRCIQRVTSAIADLAADNINFPTPAEETNTMREFFNVANMPGCIGCIDGTLIPIRGPGGDDEEVYRCRKGYYAYNVMAVCKANLSFTALVANWPGSAHDSRVFNESDLSQALQHGLYQGYLLGDSGYGCRSYLLTPFSNPRTQKERDFNASHVKTRNCVERAFGVLKRRFAVLLDAIRTGMRTTKEIIVACFVLHNIAIQNSLPMEEEEGPLDVDELEQDIPGLDPRDNAAGGQARRAEVADRFF